MDSHVNKTVAFQTRALRGALSQEQAVEKLGMNQNAISRLENPYYGKATLTTLKRIASAYDVGLVVEFVPFSQLVNRISGTPYVEYGLRPESFNVASFDNEVSAGIFERQPDLAAPQEAVLDGQMGTTVPFSGNTMSILPVMASAGTGTASLEGESSE